MFYLIYIIFYYYDIFYFMSQNKIKDILFRASIKFKTAKYSKVTFRVCFFCFLYSTTFLQRVYFYKKVK